MCGWADKWVSKWVKKKKKKKKGSEMGGDEELTRLGSLYAVPGLFMLRRATPLTLGMRQPSPISQSDCSAVVFSAICLTMMPKTSEMCSFRAPDSPLYWSWLLFAVTACWALN